MSHAHPEISYTPSNSARKNDPDLHPSSELPLQSLFNATGLSLIAILVVMVLAGFGKVAQAADQTIILNYICTTYESARQVALEKSWERPETMPNNCRTLYQRRFELRVAEIQHIIEVIPITDGRWIEIGRVRSSMASGYSAGILKELILF